MLATSLKRALHTQQLKTHKRVHTGETHNACDQCEQNFSKARTLKKHKRVHTGDTPYDCNKCEKNFSQKENLERHKRVHTV